MAKSIFNFESEDRVESPERLNEYIRVASPGVWVMVSALALVLAAFITWGVIGKIPVTLSVQGIVDPQRDCHIDLLVDASLYHGENLLGKEAAFTLLRGMSGRGKVIEVSPTPLSRKELHDLLVDDFLVDTLVTADYFYILDVEPDVSLSDYALEIGQATLILDEVSPIVFLMS